MIHWIIKNLATCGFYDAKDLEKKSDSRIHIEKVYDLVDGPQKNVGQFKSKVDRVERHIKAGQKVVIACRGGMSRSNAVAMGYLVKSGMDFYDALDLVEKKVPVAKIHYAFLELIRKLYWVPLCTRPFCLMCGRLGRKAPSEKEIAEAHRRMRK